MKGPEWLKKTGHDIIDEPTLRHEPFEYVQVDNAASENLTPHDGETADLPPGLLAPIEIDPPRPQKVWSTGTPQAPAAMRGPDAARPLLNRPSRPSAEPSAPEKAAPLPPRVALELLWWHEDRIEDLRAAAELGAHCKLAKPAQPSARVQRDASGWELFEEEAPPDPSPSTAPRRDYLAVLQRASLSNAAELPRLVDEALCAEDDDAMPLVVVGGRLRLRFDPRRELEVLLALARPLAKGARKVAEELGHVEELLETPVAGIADVARRMGDRLRRVWGADNKTLPDDYLSVTAERVLLTERAYQRVQLLDDDWLRAELVTVSGKNKRPLVAYLPAMIAKRLPLFAELDARLIAEVLPRQDGTESSPVALRVIALARVLERTG